MKRDKDDAYLHGYIRKRPDNKMAWYLLGKQYLEKGDEEKAFFCFLQAGEIYEAFENKPLALKAGEKSGGRFRVGFFRLMESIWLKSLRRILMIFAVMILLFYIPGNSPAYVEVYAPVLEPSPPADSPLPPALPFGNHKPQFYYLKDIADGDALEYVLGRMAIRNGMDESYLLKAPRTSDGGWIDWRSSPAVLLSAAEIADGRREVRFYDGELCRCQPAPAPNPLPAFASWQREKEEEAVLLTAIEAFLRKYGVAPESIGELSRPYPDNLLPGFTPGMSGRFAELRRQWQEREKPLNGQGEPSLRGQVGPSPPGNTDLKHPLQEPLRIIVDKTAHRLAVVSGNVLLRNYPVGLGGKRTPEGTFHISEKVRNPNGKSNGEFGSRGMTLSDTLYAIHGTNEPQSIGHDVSLGCIRMLNEDVEELFDLVPLGTEVLIVKGGLPKEIRRGAPRFQLPVLTEETNPKKVYRWLN